MRFILVRHGETAWNSEGRIQGQLDSPLNARGLAQAKALADRLCMESFEVLITSDLWRARSTAELIALRTRHSVVPDPRLRERHYGIFQGLTHGEAKSIHPDAYARYEQESVSDAIPGGESAEACFGRNLECLKEIAASRHRGPTVVVTHGGVLEGLYRHVMRLPYDRSRVFTLPNASLNWFTYHHDEWRLDSWGDTKHLGQSTPLNHV
jgi:probable phosphoglycerate mutase